MGNETNTWDGNGHKVQRQGISLIEKAGGGFIIVYLGSILSLRVGYLGKTRSGSSTVDNVRGKAT